MSTIFRFWRALRRRNVHKGVISYVVFSWVLLQVISVLGSLVILPIWLGKAVLITLLVLFPFWVAFSWLYDVTSEGIRLTSRRDNPSPERNEHINKRLNSFILIFLILAILLLFVDRFRLTSQNEGNEFALNTEMENSIAVLPFNDISLLQDQKYFADGLSEELIQTLSKIIGMRVTSRTSAFSFGGKTTDIPTIAKMLNVNYILEGSVRTFDSMVRVNVQLIDAKRDVSTWSETWDKPLKNIFQIQNEISTNVAERLALHITDSPPDQIRKANPEAYRLYLEGVYVMRSTFDIEGDQKAEKLFKQSLAIDSTYAPAWEHLAHTINFQTDHGLYPVEVAYPRIKEAALNTIKYDSLYAPAYALLGTIAISYEKDYQKAQDYVTKGLKISPNDIEVLNRAAEVALILNEPEKAVMYNEKIAQLSPLEEFSFYALGMTYYYAGKYPEAEKTLHKALEFTPDADITYQLLTASLLMQNRPEEALNAAKQEKSEPLRYQSLAISYHALGDKERASENLNKLISKFEKDASYDIAAVYAQMGDIEKAYVFLEKAISYNDFGLSTLNVEPYFDPIVLDPRWPILMKRLGLTY